MHRLTCTNLDVGSEAVQKALPSPRPAGARRAAGEPVRVLFVQGAEMGFATTARSLERAAAEREDIDAVHFAVRMPSWLRAACARAPSEWVKKKRLDFQMWRMMRAWGLALRGPLARLHPERFDAIHIMTQQRGMVAPWLRGRTSAAVVVNSDATQLGWDRAFDWRPIAPTPHIRLERRVFHAAHAVACASRWVAESVANDYGLPRERLILHMPCAPRPADAPVRDPHLHTARGGPLRIVFVGNAWVRKGGPRLLQWHQQRWADRAELHICSAEAPADRSCRNVVWHGGVEHGRLIGEVLPSMDFMFIPTMEDTFLIAAQEAQGAGLPVITSRLAGIPEVVLDNRTGLLADRRDEAAFIAAAERLMDDSGLLAGFSAAAADHARTALSADTWHNHLLDQIVALADARPVRFSPLPHEEVFTGGRGEHPPALSSAR